MLLVARLTPPLRAEYEAISHEFSVYKAQRDDYEQKLEGQLTEVQAILSVLKQLEGSHAAYRKYYEGEIARMQQEAAAKGVHITVAPPPSGEALRAAAAPTGGAAKRPREGGADAAAGSAEKMARTNPEKDWSFTAVDSTKVDLLQAFKHTSIVCCVNFSGNGRYVAAGCNRVAYLYDTASGSLASPVGEFQDQKPVRCHAAPRSRQPAGPVSLSVPFSTQVEGDSYIRSICFSRDNQCLVTGAEDKTVKVWDIATGRIKYTCGGEQGHKQDIYSLDTHKDGRFIASGSGDKTVKLWSPTGECMQTFGAGENGPTDGVTSVALSPDGTTLAAGSLDRVVRLWDTTTGSFLGKLGDGAP